MQAMRNITAAPERKMNIPMNPKSVAVIFPHTVCGEIAPVLRAQAFIPRRAPMA